MNQQDPNLLAKLRGELPGILNFAIGGLRRLRRNGGFTRCPSSENMREYIQQMNDTELTFISERMDRTPNGEIPSQRLYQAYREWCEENGFQRKNINQVSREWERLGFQKVRRANGSIWLGLQERPTQFL